MGVGPTALFVVTREQRREGREPVAQSTDPSQGDLLVEFAKVMLREELPLEHLLSVAWERLSAQFELQRAVVFARQDGTGPWVPMAAAGVEVPGWSDGELSAHLNADQRDQALADTDCLLSVPLRTTGKQVGVLVLIGAPSAKTITVDPGVLLGLSLCLAGSINREIALRERHFFERSTRAIRRLFEEGARADGVEEAGKVLARVAAEAFETERAGMYVTDSAGLISFAVGVGISPELSAALTESLLGKVAAASPVWQVLERNCGPTLVEVAAESALRPGGFVETLAFQSYVAIPLLSDGRPLGMVICGDASRQRAWTPREEELAKQIALEGALVVDAARLRAAERAQLAEVTHQAFHDRLTGLPNRALFLDRVKQALAVAVRNGTGVALLLIDLDDFKQVNETLGHHYGDALLQRVAARLRGMLRDTDSVARLGGDEFALLITGNAGLAEAMAVAAKVEASMSVPFDLDGISVQSVASIGVALFPDHGSDAHALVRSADTAMYTGKRDGSGPTVYDSSQHRSTLDKLTIFTELRHAIENEELRLRYQPKLDLRSNTITGVEALIRWQHPTRGLLGPDEFLSVAESTGLIDPLTNWVLSAAVTQWMQWRATGVHLDLAVNVSARNLLNRGFFDHLTEQVDRSGIACHLILEITETAVMTEPERAARRLADVRKLGVRVSMDDFGAGYSSLTQLRQLPLDELKIDRMLVRDVATNDLDVAVMETIVALGHRLSLTVVAEGIEDTGALEVVRLLGCDEVQGYHIAKPMPADDLVQLLRHWSLTQPSEPVSSARAL
jgi:diguanylate cyclase (GGDEF)-like protein